MGQTYDHGAEVDGCPDAGGIVRGASRFVMGEHQRARLANGTSGGSSWRMTAEAGIATVQATPWGGAVDPAAGPATPGQPFAATFTLREERGGVDLIGTRRSRPPRPPSSPSAPSPSRSAAARA